MADIETLGEKVQPNATTGQPNFTAAMTNLASSPSLLGQIGAQVSSAATMKLMQEKGLELGKDPDGNLPILPINDYLKQLEASYNTQSKAVLSLRGQALINQANEEMARNPMLSAGDIQTYKETLEASLTDISKMAPSGVREDLKNSFDSTVQSNTHQYATKMIAQDRRLASERQEAYINQEVSKMQESAITSNLEQAKEHKDNAVAQLSQRLIEGNMTAAEKDAQEKKLNILMTQSDMIGQAMKAEKTHGADGVEKFLADMENHKPADMDYADYSTVMAGVYKAVQQREQYKASNRSMMMSEAVNTVAATGMPLTDQQTVALRNELTTQQFNETMLRINSALTQKNSKMSAEDSLYANRANAESWYEAGWQTQKKAFDRMVLDEQSKAQSKGNVLTEVQAMTNVAKSIPIPTRAYQERLGNKISSGSPSEAMEAAVAYQTMTGGDFQDAAKVTGLDDKAKVAAAFMNLNASNGMTIDEKVALARNAAYNRTTEQYKAIEASYARYKKDHLSTTSQINVFVNNITGKPDTALVHEANSLKDDVLATHKKFFELAGSNEEVANQLTQDYVNNHYGYTNINGVKEYVLNPVEKIAGQMSSSSIPLIHEDAVNQLSEQLKLNNQRYESGDSDIHYQIEMPRTKDGTPLTYANYYTLLKEAQAKGNTIEAREANKKFSEFQKEYYKSKPVDVKVTRRNAGTETMALNIYPSRSMQQSEGHSAIGGFDVGLRGKNGLLIPFTAWMPNNINRIHYAANTKEIASRAGSMPMSVYNPEVQEAKDLASNRLKASILAHRRF